MTQVIPPRFLNLDATFPIVVLGGSGTTPELNPGVLQITASTGVMKVFNSFINILPSGVQALGFFTGYTTTGNIGWNNPIMVAYSLL